MSHLELFNAVKAAYPDKKPQEAQKIATTLWNDLKKTHGSGANLSNAVAEKILHLKNVASRSKATLFSYWVDKSQGTKPTTARSVSAQPGTGTTPEAAVPAPSTNPNNCVVVNLDVDESSPVQQEDANDSDAVGLHAAADSPVREGGRKRGSQQRIVYSDDEDEDNQPSISTKRSYAKPAQEKLLEKIQVMEKQLLAQISLRDSGLAPDGIQKQIESTKKTIMEHKKELDKKQRNAKSAQKLRSERSSALKTMVSEKPDMAKVLHVRDRVGRPLLEDDQPELFNAILEIATFGGGADRRRQSDMIRSVKTLKDLHEELQSRGFVLSQSATYLRLLPRNSSTTEGQRHHVQSAPVKLCKAQADERKNHPDGRFCTASIRAVEELVSVLGAAQCAVLSQDDKSRVPLGITAANKQAPMLMHMAYRVRLPDHDFVVAPSHKLIPSVYAGIVVNEGKIGDVKCVTYSGPTYVAVRSGKHCSSTAQTHAYDFHKLMELPNFRDVLYVNDQLKPIMVIFSDGGPDECPRYAKVIAQAVHHFKEYNFDALFLITNAPGRSAYNRVERRMSHLSRELAGLLLPHDHYGSHLKGTVTVDKELELQNFQHAGETLAAVWSDLTIDGHDVRAVYMPPGSEAPVREEPSPEWYAEHVRESQYFLQIVKCQDASCCSDWRSNLRDVIPLGFLPAPFPLHRSHEGIKIPEPNEVDIENDQFMGLLARQGMGLQPFLPTGLPVPYDYYCPTVRESVAGRTCNECGIYFASAKSHDSHAKGMGHKAPSKRKTKGKVIGRREEEALCLFEMPEPEVEWVEAEDAVDFEEVLPSPTQDGPQLVENFDDWLTSPWTTDI